MRENLDLSGVIDVHMHAAVDHGNRYRDGLELARDAAAAGMRAILLKSHYVSTVGLAKNTAQAVDGLLVFGGLALNIPAGGLNPGLVDQALTQGAKEIWMPTISAAYPMLSKGIKGEGIYILNESGAVMPEVLDILRLISEHDAILGTGHLSIVEMRALVSAARSAGVKRILVTHPESPLVAIPPAFQQEICGPDLFFERCWLSTRMRVNQKALGLEKIASEIKEIGFESTILATDLGQNSNPPPTAGMRDFISGLMDLGIPSKEIDRMARQNPELWNAAIKSRKLVFQGYSLAFSRSPRACAARMPSRYLKRVPLDAECPA